MSGTSKGGAMQMVMAIAVVALLGAGSGFVAGPMILGDPAQPDAETAPQLHEAGQGTPGKPASVNSAHEAKTPDAPTEKSVGEHGEQPSPVKELLAVMPMAKDLAVTAMPPVITNVSEPANVWIRLEGSITYHGTSEVKPELLAAQSAQQVMAYLRTITLSDVEGASGIASLTEDLDDVLRTASGGDVVGLLVTGLIIE